MDQNSWRQIAIKLQTADEREKFATLLEMRRTVTSLNPPISEIVEAKLVPILVGFLETSSIRIQIEATWILINVAFAPSERSFSILEAGGIPKLIRTLKSSNIKLATQAAWVLSNLAGDGIFFRDKIIAEDLMTVLSKLLEKAVELDLEFLQTIVWLSLNIIRHGHVQLTSVQMLFQPMLNLLTHTDRKVLVDTCWFFTNYVNLKGKFSDAFLLILLKNIALLLDAENRFVAEAALRFICAVVLCQSRPKTDQVIASGILTKIVPMILDPKNLISRLSTMCCRYITLCRQCHIQELFDHNLVDTLIQLFDGENMFWKSKREAIWLITNIINRGNLAQRVTTLMNVRLVTSCFNLLKSSEADVVKATLIMLVDFINDAFHNLPLDALEYKELLTDCGLKQHLESILDHIDDGVHERALRLMDLIYDDYLPYEILEFGEAEE